MPKKSKTLTPEEKARRKLLKKLTEIFLFGAAFSISTTLLASIIFKNVLLFYAFLFCAVIYISTLPIFYFTFIKQKIPFQYFAFLLVFLFVSATSILMFLAGGFGGAMSSLFFITIIVTALILEQRQAVYVSGLIIFIYLIFLVGETFKIIISPMGDVIVIKYAKAIIDMVSFFFVSFLITIIAKNAKDSISFYKLRSVRLSKIRERLEVLVRRRTNELEDSNKRLRKAQDELRKSYRELKKIDKKKDEFISIASHELQTPMASMHGFSQLLQDKKVFKNPEKRQKYLKIIEDETNRLSKMVKDMLNLSRIDLGTVKFDVEDVNVSELLEDIKLQMETTAKKKSLKLIVQPQKDLPKMTTDKEKLQQILINLMTNAIKYTNKGSITVSAQRENGHIRFSVADTGIGIPKSQYEKIFQRFYQIEVPATRKVLGAGLGLSIVKGFVHVMGGKIWLKSKVGKGTTFYVTLPLKFKEPKKFKPPKVKKYGKTK